MNALQAMIAQGGAYESPVKRYMKVRQHQQAEAGNALNRQSAIQGMNMNALNMKATQQAMDFQVQNQYMKGMETIGGLLSQVAPEHRVTALTQMDLPKYGIPQLDAKVPPKVVSDTAVKLWESKNLATATPRAGEVSDWVDKSGKVIGSKQPDKTGKMVYTRYKDSPVVTLGGENKYKQQFAVESYSEAMKASQSASQKRGRIDMLRHTLEGLDTDSLEGVKLGLSRFAHAIGFPVDLENLAGREAAYSIAGDLAIQMLDQFPGQISDGERKFVIDISPKLAQSPKGREALLGFFEAVAKRAQAKPGIMEPYVAGANPDLVPGGDTPSFQTKWAEYEKENPLLLPLYLANTDTLAAATDPEGNIYYQTPYGWYSEGGEQWQE